MPKVTNLQYIMRVSHEDGHKLIVHYDSQSCRRSQPWNSLQQSAVVARVLSKWLGVFRPVNQYGHIKGKRVLTHSLPQLVKFPGWKMITYTTAKSVFDGPVTNLLFNTVHIDSSPFTCSCEREKRLDWFQVWYFYWSSSDRRRGKHMAVEGLNASLFYDSQ